jgi:hypothetical protein
MVASVVVFGGVATWRISMLTSMTAEQDTEAEPAEVGQGSDLSSLRLRFTDTQGFTASLVEAAEAYAEAYADAIPRAWSGSSDAGRDVVASTSVVVPGWDPLFKRFECARDFKAVLEPARGPSEPARKLCFLRVPLPLKINGSGFGKGGGPSSLGSDQSAESEGPGGDPTLFRTPAAGSLPFGDG